MTEPARHSNPDPTPSFLPHSQIFWLPSAYFVLHTLEELPSFAEWVTRHFGPYTTEDFVLPHVPLLLLVMLASQQAARHQRHGAWAILAVAAWWQFALNALFHIGTTLLFREYTPGLVTATCLALPLTPYFLSRIRREQRLTAPAFIAALLLGTLLALAAVTVLLLK